jgi:transposase
MPRRFQRPYPEEFRREAVRLVEVSGRTVRDVTRELGVSAEGPRKWVKQAQADRGERPEKPATSELEELRVLRRRVRELEAEREILKRATAFFVRETDRR